jgi:transcription elongation regulator 1
MFEDHQNELYDKRTTAIESLFAAHAKTLTTPFDTVYAQIQGDPTVTRMKMFQDRIKRLYDEWSKRRYTQAKKDFETLLSESNFVEYWGRLKQESASKEDEHTKELLGNTANGGGDEDEDGGMTLEEAVDLKTMAAQIDIKELQAVLKVIKCDFPALSAVIADAHDSCNHSTTRDMRYLTMIPN